MGSIYFTPSTKVWQLGSAVTLAPQPPGSPPTDSRLTGTCSQGRGVGKAAPRPTQKQLLQALLTDPLH